MPNEDARSSLTANSDEAYYFMAVYDSIQRILSNPLVESGPFSMRQFSANPDKPNGPAQYQLLRVLMLDMRPFCEKVDQTSVCTILNKLTKRGVCTKSEKKSFNALWNAIEKADVPAAEAAVHMADNKKAQAVIYVTELKKRMKVHPDDAELISAVGEADIAADAAIEEARVACYALDLAIKSATYSNSIVCINGAGNKIDVSAQTWSEIVGYGETFHLLAHRNPSHMEYLKQIYHLDQGLRDVIYLNIYNRLMLFVNLLSSLAPRIQEGWDEGKLPNRVDGTLPLSKYTIDETYTGESQTAAVPH